MTIAVPGVRPSQITLAGFGEVGQAFARALLEQSVTLRVFHPRPRTHASAVAARLGLTIDTDPGTAFCDATLVLSVVPGTEAFSTASAAAGVLPDDALFVDLTSASPKLIRKSASLFSVNGYVDGAIMGAVSIHGHKTPLLTAGAAATTLQAMLEPLGFKITCLADGKPGDATALKLLRTIFTKGMDAVVIECLLAAEATGLRRQLLLEMADLDQSTISELMAMFVRTHAPHALRRMHEVESVEETLSDLGIPLIIIPAVRERYARTVKLFGKNAQIPAPSGGESVIDVVLPWMLAVEREASDQE